MSAGTSDGFRDKDVRGPFVRGRVGVTSACIRSNAYLRAYDSVSEARASVGRYLDLYNGRRPHSIDGTTPDKAYFTPLPLRLAA